MPQSVYREEEEKEEKMRERERKSKEQQSKEEVHHASEVKKDMMEKSGMSGMSFGEAKPLTEIGYMKVHIKGTLASEKHEPVVKETLAVKLVEDERKKEAEKERERIADELQKHDQSIRREEERMRETQKAEKAKAIAKEAKKEELKRKEEKEKIQERIKKEREQIKNLLDEARRKGMIEPIRDIAKKLIEREIRNGSTPRFAVGRVVLILKRLGLVKTKKEKKEIMKFLRSLFKKKVTM